MATDYEDIVGAVYLNTKLTVLRRGEDFLDSRGRHYVRYWCQCACGSQEKLIRRSSLLEGRTKSCGCRNRENIEKQSRIGLLVPKRESRKYSMYRKEAWYRIPSYNDF